MDALLFPARRLAAAVLLLALALPAAAGARPQIVDAGASGRAHVDEPLELTVVARAATGVRVSFPDLRGGFAESGCRLQRGGGVRAAWKRPARFAVPYRPGFAGAHLLEVAVTAGCGRRPIGPARVSVPLDVAEHASDPPAAGVSASPDRCGRAGERALLCLLAAERLRAGLPPLRADARLRAVALAQARAMRRGGFVGHAAPGLPGLAARLRLAGLAAAGAAENVTAASGGVAAARSIVGAWMRSDPLRDSVLDPRLVRVGAGVARGVGGPVPRPGATVSVVFAPAG
ncbi:MAG TPA: CAP domain-containing protein [Solirubrobacteraceae bacterium]|nr:CAP domain-containing protein [Solirubrobacteraceae bacterium]